MTKPLYVLAADDDSDDQLFISEALNNAEACEVRLELVCDGEQLLKRLHQLYTSGENLPELILLDLNMPVMNGKEALRALKHPRSPYRNITICVLSTSNSDHDVVSCLGEGADAFLVKPPSVERLTYVLNSELLKICVEN